MKVWLGETYIPMWFLGQPKDIKLSLTFQNPGPVDVDFEKLSSSDQKHILISLQKGYISSDQTFSTLYNDYIKMTPVVASQPKQEANIVVDKPAVKTPMDNLKDKYEENQKIMVEKCSQLLKKTMTIIRTTLKTESNTKYLMKLLELETTGKNRLTVKNLINQQLRKIQHKVQQEFLDRVEKTTETAPKPKTKEETIKYSVVESEVETVVFSSEDLERLAEGKPL